MTRSLWLIDQQQSSPSLFISFKFNLRFCDLSSILEPGRPVRTDKSAILDDTIRILNQLKNEAQELKETNEKLLEEIKTLKLLSVFSRLSRAHQARYMVDLEV
ncbi:hypothetical protein QN277_003447 [Acacia crassicarpa]|uniref:Uncharacterized protein n=1 Tax=Acacia crassicarpa TaxID=499986 RepID=A0AAE1J0Q1_9FABA|nr:hypothetical protein QN277_003447 [Acacia crassicarpa]